MLEIGLGASQVPSGWELINTCGEATDVSSWCAQDHDGWVYRCRVTIGSHPELDYAHSVEKH